MVSLYSSSAAHKIARIDSKKNSTGITSDTKQTQLIGINAI